MTVTSIVNFKNNRYKIFLNDAFAFVLYKGDMRRYDIYEGKVLSDADLQEIMEQVLIKRAKMRAMNLLQTRDYTEESMRTKLREGLYPAQAIDAAVSYVMQFHYIDDSRYAESYVRSHASSLSLKIMKEKLRVKGISDEVIESAISTYLAENGNREEELLLQLMRKKCPNPKELDYSGRQKLFASFYRKGFSLDKIERVFGILSQDDYCDF